MTLINDIEKKKKQVRKIQKEIYRLYESRRNISTEKLEKPIRYGWYIHLTLREDILKRKDAHVYQEILDVCGEWVWGRNKQDVNKNWEHYKRHRKDWQWAGMCWIDKGKYQALSEAAKKHFRAYEWDWNPWRGTIYRYYCLMPKYYCVTKFTKAYVTHRQVADGTLDSQMTELEEKLLNKPLYRFSYYAGNNYDGDKWWRKRFHKRVRQRSRAALKNYDEEHFDKMSIKALHLY